MAKILDTAGPHPPAYRDDDGRDVELRLLRSMYVMLPLIVLVSAALAPWRVTTGLLLGGVLSFFNYHWLRTSLNAVFGGKMVGVRPKLKASRYILRYFVIGSIIAAAYMFGLVSVIATLAGLCLFAAAIMVEASVQLYFAIVYREET